MSRIHLLDDSVINKIAAGEVVERPASVVKELVENAVDAGATEVNVSLELGGARSIAVTDNGSGMSRADAELAVRRHATSKIRYADDLFRIASMGFRGEALSSIASVSRFTLSTRMRGPVAGVASEGDGGTRLVIDGGQAHPPLPYSGLPGTTVSVENLFFNVPVRAKFLKAPGTEYSHCLELLQAFALCHPRVSFSLSHNGKEQFRVAAAAVEVHADGELADRPISVLGERVLRSRAAAVFGKDVESALQYVTAESRYGRVEALVSPPGFEKMSSKSLITFVNGRWVKDKTVRYGVLRGYHSHLLKGRFPVAIVHLSMDPSLVDVNVHPAKTELRFQYPAEVQNLLAHAIRDRLRDADWAAGPGAARPKPEFNDDDVGPARSSGNGSGTGSFAGASAGPRTSTYTTRSFGGNDIKRPESRAASEAAVGHLLWDKLGIDKMLAGAGAAGADLAPDARPGEVTPAEARELPWTEMDFLGAFERCYLFFSARGRLLVIDQHAFHERILFERLSRDQSLLGKSQPLLVPEAIELAPTLVQELRARRHLLVKRGFAFEPEGDTTIAVTAVPSILANRDLADVFTDLAREIPLEAGGAANADLARHLLATAACHAAVRAGEELGSDELKQLLAEAHTVDFFHNCPHGRRVLRWWSLNEVEAWFDR